jgi:hypothetical protein
MGTPTPTSNTNDNSCAHVNAYYNIYSKSDRPPYCDYDRYSGGDADSHACSK